MTTVTRTFGKYGGESETETKNSLDEETIKKETTTSLLKDIINSIKIILLRIKTI